jgi:two-component system LytT family response regulator
MTPINAIIITEENDTSMILKKFEEENFMIIKIIGDAVSIIDGTNIIKLTKPDVIFLDIIFKDDALIEMLEQLEFSIPKLVFISANENYAVKAFKHNAIDFILKPIDFNAIILVVYKLIKIREMERAYQDQKINEINNLVSFNRPNEFVAVSSLDKIDLIPMSEIIFCQAAGKYTSFLLLNGKKIMSSKNLGEYSTLLDPNYFFRIHHSYIINIRYISKISKKEGYFCELSNGVSLPIAKRRQEDFKKFIKLKE